MSVREDEDLNRPLDGRMRIVREDHITSYPGRAQCPETPVSGNGPTALWKIYSIQADILSEAKISTFEDILCLVDQVERVFDIYFTRFPLRKAS